MRQCFAVCTLVALLHPMRKHRVAQASAREGTVRADGEEEGLSCGLPAERGERQGGRSVAVLHKMDNPLLELIPA